MYSATGPICTICQLPPEASKRLYNSCVCARCATHFIGLRQAAYVIDFSLVYGAGYLFTWTTGLKDYFNEAGVRWQVLAAVCAAVLARVLLCLRDGMGGASPGKRCLGLVVVGQVSGKTIDLTTSMIRNWILLVPAIGELIILLTMQRNGFRFGDRRAGSKVIWTRHGNTEPFKSPPRFCIRCRYDLVGLPERRCPECGTMN